MSDQSEIEFLDALAETGLLVSSFDELRQRVEPLSGPFAERLMDWIPHLADARDRETVIWSLLSAAKRTLDGRRLAALFDEACDHNLQIAVAAVFHQTGPLNSDDWLINALRRTELSPTKNLLANAVARWLPVERAVPVLLAVFQTDPLAVVHPLSKIGGPDVCEALMASLPNAVGPLRRELRQAIARLKRRLAKSRWQRQCDRAWTTSNETS